MNPLRILLPAISLGLLSAAAQATTIAAYYTPEQVVIAADTRASLANGGVASDQTCKLHKFGNGIITLTGWENAGAVRVIPAIIEACKGATTTQERTAIAGQVLSGLAQHFTAADFNLKYPPAITVLIADSGADGMRLVTVEARYALREGQPVVTMIDTRQTTPANYRRQGQSVVLGPARATALGKIPGFWLNATPQQAVAQVVKVGMSDIGTGGDIDLVILTQAGLKHSIINPANIR